MVSILHSSHLPKREPANTWEGTVEIGSESEESRLVELLPAFAVENSVLHYSCAAGSHLQTSLQSVQCIHLRKRWPVILGGRESHVESFLVIRTAEATRFIYGSSVAGKHNKQCSAYLSKGTTLY